MDILVHPSRREGLARALPQAGLAGIPAIAYDIDGNREGIQHKITGMILPPFDVNKLSEAIRTLLKDESLRRRMGQAGREFAMGRFDAKVMVQALDRLYSDPVRRKQNVAGDAAKSRVEFPHGILSRHRPPS